VVVVVVVLGASAATASIRTMPLVNMVSFAAIAVSCGEQRKKKIFAKDFFFFFFFLHAGIGEMGVTSAMDAVL
jgi:hypothetical protein